MILTHKHAANFQISGLLLLIAGCIIQTLYTAESFSTAVFIIFIGSMIFTVSFVGCCGALTDSRCMVLLYSSMVVCIFLLESFFGIIILTSSEKVEEWICDFYFYRLSLDWKVAGGKHEGRDEEFYDTRIQRGFGNLECSATWGKMKKLAHTSC